MIRCITENTRIRKRFYVLIVLILCVIFLISALLLSGCGKPATTEKISVVCTIFPQYDWVCQILGEKREGMDVTMLLENRIDMHNYQPSVDDIIRISTCDLFIHVGGESDNWVDDALKSATNKDMVVINLLNALGDAAKTEVIAEGMEFDDSESEDYPYEYEGDGEKTPDYDEHVWLSLRNALIFCPIIADALSSLDADNATVYRSNLSAYLDELSAMDSAFQSAINAAPIKTMLVGDRFPFRYLADDYSLNYYAAFAGCSAETEASFDTIIFLARIADELNLRNIIVTESSDRKIARTIIGNTKGGDQQILVLDSMQSVTTSDAQSGITYISIMESNLNTLVEALQ